jgi:hypothetical protein
MIPFLPVIAIAAAFFTQAESPTVFDYSSALAQGDWCPGPALTCGQIRCLRNLKVLDAGQVLYDFLAVGIPPSMR